MHKISFEIRDIESLIPYARNSRTHTEEQIEQVAKSIKEFGFLNPVIVSADGGIIAGHCRVMAAKKLGIKEVPCILESHLTDAQKRAYIIADNQLALNAGWDEEMLRIELADLKDENFDLDLLGFSTDELVQYLESDGGNEGGDGEESDSGAERESAYKEQYGVIVMCKDESEQERVYNRLMKDGYTCKVVTT